MPQLTMFEEAQLTKPLQQYWSGFDRVFDQERLSYSPETPPPSSVWQCLIKAENEDLYADDRHDGWLDSLDNSHDDGETLAKLGHVEPEVENCLPGDLYAGIEDCQLSDVYGSTWADEIDNGDVFPDFSIRGLRSHELPVKGISVHSLIVPGFYYSVRPVDSIRPLFEGKALCLQTIGKGYGKRLTFEGESLTENDNYFWSDSNPEGYGFSLHLIKKQDKFTVKDVNGLLVGNVEVEEIVGKQMETGHKVTNHAVEKEAKVILKCSIQYFEGDFPTHERVTISGTAVSVKNSKSRKPAQVVQVRNCKLNGQKGFTLVSRNESFNRSLVVSGNQHNDVPTSYNVTGFHDHEVIVIGTIVDSRIVPGFKYRVRPLDSKRFLFEGVSLTLLSIGKGYGKRLTFAGESLTENHNYFWSDTNPAGYGFTLEAVSEGEVFRVEDSHGIIVGSASVYKTDLPQKEIQSFVNNGVYVKMVRVSISCHLSIYGQPDLTTTVTGIAVMERKGKRAEVISIEDIAITAQMNDLWASEDKSIRFIKV